MDNKKFTGVVLAGGRSSRMGQDKAFLDYKGKPLLDHMIGVLEGTGLSNIYVSGNLEEYRCIPDNSPYGGPARAMQDVLSVLEPCDGVLFVPVDMPFLTPSVLNILLTQQQSAYFEKRQLPAFFIQSPSKREATSVHGLLEELGALPIFLPDEFESIMVNTNTPEEWQEALYS